MAVNWGIGCVKCKVHIDMGSQKIYRWSEYKNIKDIIKFILNHTFDNETQCQLFIGNDASYDYWDYDESEIWEEDILSKSFNYDSKIGDKLICAGCKKEISKTNNNTILQKNQSLMLCNDDCYHTYRNEILDSFWFVHNDIFDSTEIYKDYPESTIVEMGCNQCKEYVIIDSETNKDSTKKDYEYLAEFLQEHTGIDHKHLICFKSTDKIKTKNIPWRIKSSKDNWKEYMN